MFRNALAILLAIITCAGWGTVSPLMLAMLRSGGDKFHPMQPYIWNTIGIVVIMLLVVVMMRFTSSPIMAWHWSGPAIALVWPIAGIAVTYAYYLAPERASVINTITMAYPALISAPLLWYFFAESMNAQKIFGMALTFAGVVITIFAK